MPVAFTRTDFAFVIRILFVAGSYLNLRFGSPMNTLMTTGTLRTENSLEDPPLCFALRNPPTLRPSLQVPTLLSNTDVCRSPRLPFAVFHQVMSARLFRFTYRSATVQCKSDRQPIGKFLGPALHHSQIPLRIDDHLARQGVHNHASCFLPTCLCTLVDLPRCTCLVRGFCC